LKERELSHSIYTDKLIRRLRGIHRLDADDEAAIHALPLRVAQVPSRHDVVREGERPNRCCIVFEGMTAWYKVTGQGVRQILSLQIAGDIPDLHSLHMGVMDSSLLTISPCTMGFVDHDAMRRLCEQRPQVASALWRSTLIDGAVFREWVTNVGGRKGFERVAHLLCELISRMRVVGLVSEDFTCTVPLTQADISQATGLSTVHVNRALQNLRKKGLIQFEKFVLKVVDWDGLQEHGDFDPTYLNLIERNTPPTPATP
jgi:CRP-like cAMP-binding protein